MFRVCRFLLRELEQIHANPPIIGIVLADIFCNFIINERVTLYVHICVCVVSGLVACSHARMLILLELILHSFCGTGLEQSFSKLISPTRAIHRIMVVCFGIRKH